jgi:hypothetical protein
MKSWKLLLSVVGIFAFSGAFAVEQKSEQKVLGHVLLTPEEMALQNKAKKRMYPGGRDEEPLVVQLQLPQPVRKMGPASEVPEDEPHD